MQDVAEEAAIGVEVVTDGDIKGTETEDTVVRVKALLKVTEDVNVAAVDIVLGAEDDEIKIEEDANVEPDVGIVVVVQVDAPVVTSLLSR